MHYFRYIKKVITVLILVGLMYCPIPEAKAFDMIDSPRDIISTADFMASAYHDIRFSLLEGSDPVAASDYIFLDLPAFRAVTEPTSITGTYTGTPTYSVIGTRIRITGISFEAGNQIAFSGITAFNPGNADQFDIYIRIADNPDGINPLAYTHVLATTTDGSVTVSAAVPARVGTLRVQGLAPAGMFVNFAEDGNVIGTTTANDDGTFTQIFPGMTPKSHTILVFGTDSENRNTPPTVIEAYTTPYEVTTVSDILLPPTISLDTDQINRGDTITISGHGVPGYTVKIFTEPPLTSFEVTIQPDATYSYQFADTADLPLGDHKVYALMQSPLGTQSLFSSTLFYKVVGSVAPPEGGDPEGDISKGDLNNDSIVNLVDFSILLFYWGGNSRLADVNGDEAINLIDFSIMMFYWNG